ncbi:MAG TPA: VacJ family lipoprotein [Chromatiales bacterium]|nr:VacJ family lipoprotein [Chromatiales bacterium]
MDRWKGGVVAILTAIMLSGCATISDEYRDPRDPWEAYNRAMTRFNDEFDKYIGKPVAKGYREITPAAVDKGITNFFNNLYDVTSALNNLLQLKPVRAVSDVGRVIFNSTFGLFGIFDVASGMDFPSYKEDFGQTLGYWGVSPGPYFVLPILGPSNVRDTVGLVGDAVTNPVSYVEDDSSRIGLILLRGIDQRADLLSATKVLEEAALDPYEFTRDAYLQKRLNDVYDGDPPVEEEDDFPEEDLPE